MGGGNMHRWRPQTEDAFTIVELLVGLVVLVIVVSVIVLTIIAFIRSPDEIGLSEVGRVGGAGGAVTITYRVDFTYEDAPTATVSEDVDIEEVDFGPFQNDLLDLVTVTTAAGATKGSALFTLVCGPSSVFGTYLEGPKGSSLFERTHLILAEYERILLWNIRSDEVTVDCRAVAGGAGEGGTGGTAVGEDG